MLDAGKIGWRARNRKFVVGGGAVAALASNPAAADDDGMQQ